MSRFLDQLNPEQRAAAAHLHGPQLILAGAGTGKTRVMTYRMAHMLTQDIQPGNIAAVTFTNKAAEEMRERVAKLVGTETSRQLQISTFHSFCLKILKKSVQHTHLRPGFTILDTSDQIDMVRRAMDDLRLRGTHQPMDLLVQISAAKNQLLEPRQVPTATLTGSSQIISDPDLLAMVYENYQNHLKFNNVIDFDDCIFAVYRLLSTNEAVRELCLQQYRFLMVDEFQDTNFAQLELVRLLAGPDANVCVVGDDDQSIYSWRGAMYETIARFESYFPGLKITRLEQNYRCTDTILRGANAVIKNNPIRKSKTLWSEERGDDPIRLTRYLDETAEANGLAERILGLMGRGHRPRDAAILMRSSIQAKPLELALRELRIPYKVYGGQSFFEKKEVKDFLAYLRLVLNPADHLGFYRVINIPTRGIGIKTLEKIHAFSHENKIPPLKAAVDPAMNLAGSTRDAIHEFHEKIHVLHVLPARGSKDLEEISERIVKEFRLGLEVENTVKDPDSRAQRLDLLRSLPAWIGLAAKSHIESHREWDSLDFIANLMLDQTQGPDRKDKKSSFAEREHVCLMTIHAAKGLEFPYVFVCGLEDDMLPHKNSLQDQGQIHEERRLMYVAMTRAKKALYLSNCHYRNFRKQKVAKTPSRFIAEIPADSPFVIEDAGHRPPQTEENRDQRVKSTLSKLADLRNSL